jgi:signal transduction histidine kinase
MVDSSFSAELRKYRALAWTLVATLFVSVALFVQFMRMDRTANVHTFSSSAEHAITISGLRIAQLLEQLNTIGREYLLLGASDAQLLSLIRALDIDKKLISLCALEGDTVHVLHAAQQASTTASRDCAASFSSSQTVFQLNDRNSPATDLRIIPPSSGDAPSLEIRLRDSGSRELRATMSSTALLDALMLDNETQMFDSVSVCLSLRLEGSFHELSCHIGEFAAAAPEIFLATENSVARQIDTAGQHWRIVITPHLQLLAGTITLLPFTMFGVALMIGAVACVFAYQTTDKNIRIEAHAGVLQTRLEQVGQLEQQNNLLDQFAAMAAHDLQAPLRFIVSNAHLLIAELEELEQTDLAQLATLQVEQGMRMRALVLDLLEFCRAGQSKLITAPVDTRKLVREEVALLKANEEYAGTQFVIGSLPDALICDADKLAHILRNLLGNAVKFSQASSPAKVSISASRSKLHGPWTFRVKDNGPGISEEHRELIFRPFARLDSNAKGTGMGLAIVKLMLERHGGTIFIESSDSEGSTFCFTMPGAMPARTVE